MFLHEWTSHQLGIWVPYSYDSLHLHSCLHVNNMTLTDTADTNCHNSYYSNAYLFDIATSNQRIYTHKLNSTRAHLQQIKTSTKDKSHSWLWQSTCSTICNQIALCNSILFAIYFLITCNPLSQSLCWLIRNPFACNLQCTCFSHPTSTCNILAPQSAIRLLFAYKYYWHLNCPQFAIRWLFAYNYYWHSNCPQFAIRLLNCIQLLLVF